MDGDAHKRFNSQIQGHWPLFVYDEEDELYYMVIHVHRNLIMRSINYILTLCTVQIPALALCRAPL